MRLQRRFASFGLLGKPPRLGARAPLLRASPFSAFPPFCAYYNAMRLAQPQQQCVMCSANHDRFVYDRVGRASPSASLKRISFPPPAATAEKKIPPGGQVLDGCHFSSTFLKPKASGFIDPPSMSKDCQLPPSESDKMSSVDEKTFQVVEGMTDSLIVRRLIKPV